MQEKRAGNRSLGRRPVEGLRAGQSPSGLGFGDAFQFSQEDFADVVRVLRAQEAGAVRMMRGGAAPDCHGHSSRVRVELFASAYCVAGRAE